LLPKNGGVAPAAVGQHGVIMAMDRIFMLSPVMASTTTLRGRCPRDGCCTHAGSTLTGARWDYHHLWASNPDGTGQMTYYGNLHPGTLMIDASRSRSHAKWRRSSHRDTDAKSMRARLKWWKQISATPEYRDPWALSEEMFVAAKDATLVSMNGKRRDAGIV
jgi:hypothetical protein